VQALVVGGASSRHRGYESELRRRIAAADLGDTIHLLGDRPDLREIMAVASLVLSLSRQPESFGRTVLEALSLGTPVAGYAQGGVGEILERLYPAGRVPPGDLDALEQRVSSLLDRPQPVPASDEYALEHMLDATLDLYRGLAGERRDRA
jgi:glycosyltransferase involved in cell wall biosynthesis